MKPSILRTAAAILLLAPCAFAQDAEEKVDCKEPVTQHDMSYCAAVDAEAADKDLNTQYRKTRDAVIVWDKDLSDDLKGAEKALKTAQRAWIAFRDAQCELDGFQARGGTMEPMLVSGCIATLTRERTKQLKEIQDGLGN